MNKYELVCLYCDFSWQTNYLPQEEIHCSKCDDRNVRAIDLAATKVDYYAGAPAFADQDTKNWNY